MDGFRMVQVFTNILSNAIKYSPPEQEVSITSAEEGEFFIINFSDKGYGFTSEEMETVWRPFSPRSDQKPAASFFNGAGIGFYLAKTIIEQHGGTISIISPGRNQGSNIRIALPLNAMQDN